MPNPEIKGIGSLAAKLTELALAQTRAAVREVKVAALNIQNGARRRVRVDRGRLRNAISHEVTEDGLSATIGMVGTEGGAMAKIAMANEFGRRAGSKQPPTEEIRGWARRHGIDPKLAFVIARSIGRKGTPAQPFLFPAFDEEIPRFRARLMKAMEKAARSVAGGVK